MSQYKIKITKDGPYIVSGNVPLNERVITSHGESEVVFTEGRPLPQKKTHSLCRCGKSRNTPFCDGSHVAAGFDGTEKASRKPYLDRAACIDGQTYTVYDDGRCAFARFCHSDRGKIGRLLRRPEGPEDDAAALKCVQECPAGRLTAYDKAGNVLEPALEPAVSVVIDPDNKVCGPLYVQGGIPIESADGSTYEVRNRVTVCRCGKSTIKPFCDASHVADKFTEIEHDVEAEADDDDEDEEWVPDVPPKSVEEAVAELINVDVGTGAGLHQTTRTGGDPIPKKDDECPKPGET